MKRAILLLATATLGVTGCYSRRDPGTMTFYWNFQDAQGRVAGNYTTGNTGCDVAGVDTVQVVIDNGTFTATCVGSNGVPGVQLQQFLPGAYPFTVNGLRNGEVVFTISGTANADYNVDSQVAVTLGPVNPQSLVVFYDVNGLVPTQCVFNGIPVAGLVYRLVDQFGNIVSTTEINGGLQQAPIACDPLSFGFSIPSKALATYTFKYLSAVDINGNAIVQTCSDTVLHGGFPAIVNLTTATGICPL